MTYVERAEKFDVTLAAAVAGKNADQALAGLLADPALDMPERTRVAAALGDTRGPAGSAALRKAFSATMERGSVAGRSTWPQERDLICACVIALARRDGPAATDVYLAASGHTNAVVRTYGVSALAPVGDDRAWDAVLARLEDILHRKTSPDGRRWEEAADAIQYLARHSPAGSERAVRLVTLLRNRWRNLADPGLVEQWWPGIRPGGQQPETIDQPGLHTPDAWWRRGRD